VCGGGRGFKPPRPTALPEGAAPSTHGVRMGRSCPRAVGRSTAQSAAAGVTCHDTSVDVGFVVARMMGAWRLCSWLRRLWPSIRNGVEVDIGEHYRRRTRRAGALDGRDLSFGGAGDSEVHAS